MTRTFIPGKDEALEVSINTMQQRLVNLGFDIEEASWLNPVPNVWSVHIRDKQSPACFTNGKGASKDAALASALGEYFERLACNYFFADFYMGEKIANSEFVHYPNEKWFPIAEGWPAGLMDDYLKEHYDPEQDVAMSQLVDVQSSNEARGVCALPFERQSDGQQVYIPMNIVGNLYVSNGMSAGNTKTEARTQALSECFERYVKNRIIAECISLPEIPAEVLARYPKVVEAIAKLEAEGFPITCFDASLGGEYPVICVTLFNPVNGGCFASFGAHPRFGVALERTVTELLQGRGLKDLDIFPTPSFNNDEVADHTNIETHFIDSSGLVSWDLFKQDSDYPFADWDFSGSTQEEFSFLLEKFRQLGADVYIADYEHLATYACRVLVPGYSEIYPADDLHFANNNRGTALRRLMDKWLSGDADSELAATILEEVDALNVDEFQPLDQLLGIAVDNNSPWSTLRIGELRCLLALALGELEDALDWAQWTVDFNAYGITADRQPRLRFYHAVLAILQAQEQELDLEQYLPQFKRMFTATHLDAALAHINQQAYGYDLHLANGITGFTKHQSLIAAYDKLQRAKAAHGNWPK
ncbi:30S ribosomal protein S12 methylthiotransferase accessory factor YcaO [Shewanella sp. C32]|uniref:30S ribosomal protein S12 methylthiotransferase accessory factor YcaO n=1 Tax=Shewanella electrica TaxID=515560 RepID=A0ABT2FHG7_9GAMM|nr:30S ribosomal protein S12 methylthiotransferase accessory factor YcaO [Shewanella electrica]MCH1923664.1 YcaO-like family protein [Shewanella electrica]MCS4555759.1 30S ribosomal protein S12 methylthiotransferase accessory factor YcaO [Shewanella electrica]